MVLPLSPPSRVHGGFSSIVLICLSWFCKRFYRYRVYLSFQPLFIFRLFQEAFLCWFQDHVVPGRRWGESCWTPGFIALGCKPQATESRSECLSCWALDKLSTSPRLQSLRRWNEAKTHILCLPAGPLWYFYTQQILRQGRGNTWGFCVPTSDFLYKTFPCCVRTKLLNKFNHNWSIGQNVI